MIGELPGEFRDFGVQFIKFVIHYFLPKSHQFTVFATDPDVFVSVKELVHICTETVLLEVSISVIMGSQPAFKPAGAMMTEVPAAMVTLEATTSALINWVELPEDTKTCAPSFSRI